MDEYKFIRCLHNKYDGFKTIPNIYANAENTAWWANSVTIPLQSTSIYNMEVFEMLCLSNNMR